MAVGTVSLAETKVAAADPLDFWSLQPLRKLAIPIVPSGNASWVRNPIDAFVMARLRAHDLRPSAEADRRALIRRLYFDLIGLPPAPEEIAAFVDDPRADAYEKLVDRLLGSEQYGEKWARHWLDIVHYGDSHGYDKDQPRPNAWPYRDYVIRAFNDDKPYARFIVEQLAGDVLFPLEPEVIPATGFISAGPWDLIGHAEVPESKIDGQIARSLDRDDMVANTFNSFLSTTVQCARCHDHKFDPVTQRDYYSLQAVFAALDRADRKYDSDPAVAKLRASLTREESQLRNQRRVLDEKILHQAGPELARIDQRLAELKAATKASSAAFGYHSQIMSEPDMAQWVQVDLGASKAIAKLIYAACHDDFNGIGAGFGFPPRFKIELSDDAQFASGVRLVSDRTQEDVLNPGTIPQVLPVGGHAARFVRFTATKLALRQNDYIFALAELAVLASDGTNLAAGGPVTALTSIEAPVRWARSNLVDGYYPGTKANGAQLAEVADLTAHRTGLIEGVTTTAMKIESAVLTNALRDVERRLASLPKESVVYAGTVYSGSGAFAGTGGKPRAIHLLHRGDVRQRGELATPGTVPFIRGVAAQFAMPEGASEGDRRAALAQWIVHPDNPLTWRSIVNRVWQYHIGHGLVGTANDFGRMGEQPTHPELLDWLAVEFRDGGGSLKKLHCLIVTSATYRQSSADNDASARIDANNLFLWRMNRRRLEAEEIRDAILWLAGKLNQQMYGPAFQDFVIEKPEHSPHYEYDRHDPEDPKTHRRSIYRFLVRSQPSPFMTTLDCADPSQNVARRSETLTALQALALLNNKFVVNMSKHFAARVEQTGSSMSAQLTAAHLLALGRSPSATELVELTGFNEKHGLASSCRVLLNLNEFVFVD